VKEGAAEKKIEKRTEGVDIKRREHREFLSFPSLL
jgi:hypothetical protein